jgi:hypothetical protein
LRRDTWTGMFWLRTRSWTVYSAPLLLMTLMGPFQGRCNLLGGFLPVGVFGYETRTKELGANCVIAVVPPTICLVSFSCWLFVPRQLICSVSSTYY